MPRSSDIEVLGLEEGALQRRAAFLVAYANMALRELDDHDMPVGDRWVSLAEAATAYRDAAQAALLIDIPSARLILAAAGQLYDQLGLPFGLFLRELADPSFQRDPPRRAVVGMLRDLGRLNGTSDAGRRDIPEPLHHLPQQAYGWVSATGLAHRLPEIADVARGLADSVHSRGVAPVGALGTPLFRYWRIGELLLAQRPFATPSLISEFADHLQVMAEAYGRTVLQARMNDYSWYRQLAPVDTVDVDVVGLTALVGRTVGRGPLGDEFESRGLSDVALIPIRIGLDFDEPEDTSTPSREPVPWLEPPSGSAARVIAWEEAQDDYENGTELPAT